MYPQSMAAVNLVYFVACARWYRFKQSDAGAAVELEEKDGKVVVATGYCWRRRTSTSASSLNPFSSSSFEQEIK